MAREDINKKEFDAGTLLKLDIFRRCFREWFPVFLHAKGIERIFIFDLFAGSGYDAAGNPGSPIILLQESRGAENQHCLRLRDHRDLQVVYGFNEKKKEKSETLKNNVADFFSGCHASCPLGNTECVLKKRAFVLTDTFKSILERPKFLSTLQNPRYAKFILLDQYGVKEVNEDVFKTLVSSPKTDFIFFITSSTIRRFAEHPAIKKYFETAKIDFANSTAKEAHRLIAEYYKSLIPEGVEYFLHSFTIRKDSNYYGLIFGSSHSLGMEKFLHACWKEDPYSGDSNCNLDNDWPEDTLFANREETVKKNRVKTEIKTMVTSGAIVNNVEGLFYALRRGCEPKIFVDVIDELLKEGEIRVSKEFNRTATKIHCVKRYTISVMNK